MMELDAKHARRSPRGGFTLIELMITVAILSIIAAIAIPAYNAYIRESRLGAMRMNLDTLRIAVEAFRLDDPGSSYKPAGTAPSYVYTSAKTTIKGAYGWEPEGGEAYSYTVTPTSTTYSLLAEQGSAFWVRCEKDPEANPSFRCCATGDSGASKNDCP